MMMSPWIIYIILQLDSILNFIAFAMIISAIALIALGLIALGFGHIAVGDISVTEEELGKARSFIRSIAKKVAAVFLVLLAAATFVPNTKTAAAIVVLPAIANNDSIRSEAADLYKFAKQALENAASPDGEKNGD